MTHIIVITYKSGSQAAYFKHDEQLLEALICDNEYIEEVQEIPFEGNIETKNERTLREMIRKIGKTATRDLLNRICQENS